MEELSIEKKAKAYDEALEKAKDFYKGYKQRDNQLYANDLETIFPELRESKDEKIRQKFIKLVKMSNEVGGFALHKWEADEMLAWLEKQGKQKPADKVVPKFQNGQWIVWQNKCYKVNYNGCGYELIDQNGLSTSLEYGTVDASARLWDITKDARDGDVLYFYNDISGYHSIGLFRRLAPKNETYGGTYRCYTRYGGFNEENRLVIAQNNIELCHCGTEACPATKFQRDTLFAKMKEEGYEWSEETHELKKISQRMVSAEAKEALYDKPTDEEMKELLRTEYEKGRADTLSEMKSSWSEEDEKMLNGIVDEIQANRSNAPSYDIPVYEGFLNWLKSLRPQKQWKPSDEQMKVLLSEVEGWTKGCPKQIVLESLYNDLKKLK